MRRTSLETRYSRFPLSLIDHNPAPIVIDDTSVIQ